MFKAHRSVAVAAAITVSGMVSVASAAPAIDGTRDAEYGAAASVQTVQTQFGDNQSELNAFYYNYDSATGKLNVLITGNVESNNNKLVLFFDTRAGGQNTLRSDNPDVNFNNLNRRYGQQTITASGVGQGNTGPGFTFDTGFDADYFLSFNRSGDAGGTLYSDFAELRTNGGGVGGFLGQIAAPNLGTGQGTIGGGNLPTIGLGYNDTNAAGVTGGTGPADQTAAAAVTTGLEFSIDVSSLDINGDFKLMAFVNGADHDYVSNQFIPGLTVPQGNLGGDMAGNGVQLGTDPEGNSRGQSVAGINLQNLAGNQFLTVPIVVPTYAYNVDANGNYSNPANFTGNVVPTGVNGRVLFGNVITAPRTVTIDQDVSLISLNFDSSNAYTLAGPSTISLAAASTAVAVNVRSGNHVISAPVTFVNDPRVFVAANSSLSVTGAINATGKNLFKDGKGALSIPATTLNSISVVDGALRLTGNGVTAVRGVFIRGAAGTFENNDAVLDLTNSALVVDYDENFFPNDLLAAAANGRLTSSTLTGPRYAMGYVDSARDPALIAYGNTPLDATAFVLRQTLRGDANLDLTVNFADLVRLAQNYNQTDKLWYQGDFNYDLTVNFADLVALAQNYNQQATPGSIADAFGSAFASEWAAAQAAVPEPTSLLAVAAAGGLLVRRRK